MTAGDSVGSRAVPRADGSVERRADVMGVDLAAWWVFDWVATWAAMWVVGRAVMKVVPMDDPKVVGLASAMVLRLVDWSGSWWDRVLG